MTQMVQIAVAGDVTDGEELQALLTAAGIESSLEAAGEDDPLVLLVPETDVDAAKDAIEALTEPDDLLGEA